MDSAIYSNIAVIIDFLECLVNNYIVIILVRTVFKGCVDH